MDQGTRQSLATQLGYVRQYFSGVFADQPNVPAVARVVLKDNAIAKSHRPRALFSQNSCPIIGGETFGSLLISVSDRGLARLEQDATGNNTNAVTADRSTVDHVEPFTAGDAAGEIGLRGLSNVIGEKQSRHTKFRLFEHKNAAANEAVRTAFFDLVESLGLAQPESLPYISGVRVYRVRDVMSQAVPHLARFVGTQSLGIFPQYKLFAQYIPQGSLTSNHMPQPEANRQYPVVGVIDSGTDPNNALLQSWVVDRDEDDVPPTDQDNNHGSFVAGLIINGRRLNHDDPRFPMTQAKIVDVVAMPKADTPVEEVDLLRTIRRAVKKYQDVRIWNLSVSRTDMVCRDDTFSDFAMELDAIQRQYDVTFVTCGGNYAESPLRGWPPEDLGERDRVYPPADAALSVTVGSLAHIDRSNSRVRREEPSPFTRRGPGAAFLPKPDVCHYGGNCAADLNYHQSGIVSLDGAGHVAEAIGTSFSTPLVTSLLANIRAGVVDAISRNLAKALLVQSAALRGGPIVPEHLRYRGFGVPSDLDDILTCAAWQATLVLEPELHPQRRLLAREDFPIPDCFRRADGRVEGEFLLTLVYDPPLDTNAGAEYCQANVDVSLGTYDIGTDGKPEHHGKIPLDPHPSELSKLYEKNLVEYGFKWSPVKVYRKRLKATAGKRWRIKLQLLHRSEVTVAAPQHVALIATLFDPKRQKPVYNDVVTAMNRSGWISEDLRVDERIQARTRG